MNISFTTLLVCLCLQCIHTRPNYYNGRTRKPKLQRCTNSQECSRGSCCRNTDGNIIGVDGFGSEAIIGNGTCTPFPSGPGEVCGDECGCVKGYLCYRTITGACCPPKTCWERKKALADKEFWANCNPPTCFLPPSANPGNGQQGII